MTWFQSVLLMLWNCGPFELFYGFFFAACSKSESKYWLAYMDKMTPPLLPSWLTDDSNENFIVFW